MADCYSFDNELLLSESIWTLSVRIGKILKPLGYSAKMVLKTKMDKNDKNFEILGKTNVWKIKPIQIN